MAPFNPDAGVDERQTRDQTGVSRGTGTNRAFESLFKGLGDAIGGAATVADTAIKDRIERDAMYGFESQNDEFYASSDTAPPELIRSGEGLQKLADAHAQGRLTQEYYYGRLAATLKGLRSRYPGYEREVDQIVQSVTGVRPANAYRDALWSSAESLRREQASSAGKFDSWASTKENSEILGILYPDFFSNPEKYASEDAKNRIRADVSQYQGRLRMAEDYDKLQSSDKKVSLQQAGKLFSTVVNGYIVGGSEAVGVGQPDVHNMIQSALSDGTIDQDEKERIMGFLSQIKAKAMVDIRDRAGKSDWAASFTSAEVNSLVDEAIKPITEMENLVSSDNVSGAVRIAERNKAMTDQANFEMYQRFPELATVQALRRISEVGADTVVQQMIEDQKGGTNFLNSILGKDLSEGVISGTVTMDQVSERVSSAAGKTEKEKEALLNQTLSTSTAVLASPDVSPEIRSQTVRSVYADNLDKTWSVVSDETGSTGVSQRMRLFSKMFSPQITKEIAALDDPEMMRIYSAAAADKFQQIPEFRRAAASLGSQIPYSKYARVRYDDQKNRMIVEVNREALGNASWFRRTDEAIAGRELVQATDAFNQAITLMAPIIEASDVDETEGIAALAEQLSLNLDGGRGGVWSWISQGIVENVDKLMTGRISPEGGTAHEGSRMFEAGQENFENQSRAVDPNFTGDWEEIGTQQSSAIADEDVRWSLGESGELPALPVESMPRLDGVDTQEVSSVRRAGRGWTEVELPDGSVVRRTGARNWRNNNPGNIEYGAFARQHGALGTDGRFAVFPSYEAGRAAKEALLFESRGYRNRTISSAISRYAPAFENDTAAYASAVARAVGVPSSTPLSDLTPSQRQRMLDAMERVEGFRRGRQTVVSG